MSDKYPYLTEDDEFDCENGSSVDLMVLVNSIRRELAAKGAEIARLRGDVKKALAFVQEEQNAWGASWRIQTVARILLDTLSEASDGHVWDQWPKGKVRK